MKIKNVFFLIIIFISILASSCSRHTCHGKSTKGQGNKNYSLLGFKNVR